MKTKLFFTFIITFLIISCSNNKKFTPEFIKQFSGRYFYNLDETIGISFNNNIVNINWKGHKNIKPLRLKENVFFVKEMNEKIQFLINPENNLPYIGLIPKDKNKKLTYDYKKMEKNEEIPSSFLKNKEYEKALNAYLILQKDDNASSFISESYFNKLGYYNLRNDLFLDAIEVFKINAALFPESSNVYDSLGEAYAKNKDTLLAVINYKKSLGIDSGNRHAKRYIKKYDKEN